MTASDLASGEASKGWSDTGQHAAALDALYKPEILGRAKFDDHVSFMSVDMTVAPHPNEAFDFCWSVCSLEHLGSLKAGMDFVMESKGKLKGRHRRSYDRIQSDSK
ncbi:MULTISPECIES: hypothetical protein [unclassified Mesorhizobium]|uniref:hypothetical protein n=1 Tax=unclassified Mesorhizobium TaxID=325217 RepID=UPI0012EB897F|nr:MULTISPECIES: hypothetical protein [unclassified Mesorhizobium]